MLLRVKEIEIRQYISPTLAELEEVLGRDAEIDIETQSIRELGNAKKKTVMRNVSLTAFL